MKESLSLIQINFGLFFLYGIINNMFTYENGFFALLISFLFVLTPFFFIYGIDTGQGLWRSIKTNFKIYGSNLFNTVLFLVTIIIVFGIVFDNLESLFFYNISTIGSEGGIVLSVIIYFIIQMLISSFIAVVFSKFYLKAKAKYKFSLNLN